MTSESTTEATAFQAAWEAGHGRVPAVVNLYVLQHAPSVSSGQLEGGIYLTFGHTAPPIILNDTDRAKLQDETGGRLPVTSLGTFYMTRRRAEEFYGLLGTFLEQARQMEQAQSGEGRNDAPE